MALAASPKALRIAVIGAGVVGLAVGLELRRRGARVSVYERGIALGAGATVRSAGMLGAAFDWPAEEPRALADLAADAGAAWPEFASGIEGVCGRTLEVSTEGALAVARDTDDLAWLDRLAAACAARGLAAELLTADALRRREPALADAVVAGLLFPGDRQVDPLRLLPALGAAFVLAGGALKLGEDVRRLEAGGIVFKLPDGEVVDVVVLATGAAALPQILGAGGETLATGLPAPVPVKGQMLALAPGQGTPRHVIHAPDVYLAPKERWVLVGATLEPGRDDETVEPETISALRARAAVLCPALGQAAEAARWAGVRPGSPDDAPLIGATAVPGVFAALGHYRNGVLLAPASARLIANVVLDGSGPPAAFDPRRFAKARFDKPAAPRHSP